MRSPAFRQKFRKLRFQMIADSLNHVNDDLGKEVPERTSSSAAFVLMHAFPALSHNILPLAGELRLHPQGEV